jgi:chitodextrinase
MGVTGYLVYRDAVQVASVIGTSFGDQGLAPGTLYSYQVRAADAAGNQSDLSSAATASTMAPPPPPEVTSVTLSATNTDCLVTIEVTVEASALMDAVLNYIITCKPDGSVPLTFIAGNLSQTVTLATDGDGTVGGTATASAGGGSDSKVWLACTTP